MNRVLDKSILLTACAASLLFVPPTTLYLVALLSGITVAALGELRPFPPPVSTVGVGIYLATALAIPEFVLFAPLVAYDYLRKESWFFRLIWFLPVIIGMRFFDVVGMVFLVALSAISFFLSRRTVLTEKELATYRVLRDELREESLSLESKNRDLRDRQDMDIHLATLDERGRIAREIHDNVGHLLTRSVLQVEAFQVVHADNPQVLKEFEEVGATVNEALDTVRASVHKLHDDAFDLEAQLKRTIEESKGLSFDLDYQAVEVPSSIGYCFIALTREAISNTLKHSNASRMKIDVLEQPGFYRLTLADDGKGGGTFESEEKSGIGLRTMEDRVRSLSGIFRIDSKKGFRIIASIPRQEMSES